MKNLFENWRRYITEEVNLQAGQELINANPYLKGKLAATKENVNTVCLEIRKILNK